MIAKTEKGNKALLKRIARNNAVWILGLLIVIIVILFTWRATLAAILMLVLIGMIAGRSPGMTRGLYLKIGIVLYIIACIVIPATGARQQEQSVTSVPSATNGTANIPVSPPASGQLQTDAGKGNENVQQEVTGSSSNSTADTPADAKDADKSKTPPTTGHKATKHEDKHSAVQHK